MHVSELKPGVIVRGPALPERAWGLKTTQIHGGMKIGDRDTPNTRIYAEREFREDAQILVATEAAGEGINLQFCWFMINYDIPWNPVRLEQRIGRIHRYGQEKDCLVFNFVAKTTREGRVLAKLHERLQEIRSELGTDKVFDVVGDVFPAATLEKLFREMYAQRMDVHDIEARIVKDVDPQRFRQITHSTLEGLAKRELNLSAIAGKSAEAKERRLVPEVIHDFFIRAAPLASVHPRPVQKDSLIYRIGKLPRTLAAIGEKLEPRFGRLGKDYQRIAFDKATLQQDPTLEWVTPGHPLFEAVRADVTERVQDDLKRGAVLYDLNITSPLRLDVFGASIKDGRGNTVSRRLFVVQTDQDGTMAIARKPHPHDDKTFIDVRFVEVKGRAGVGEVALSSNEYRTAERLKKDYWLYVAFHCASAPELHVVQDPTRLGWQAVMAVAHYQVGPQAILGAEMA